MRKLLFLSLALCVSSFSQAACEPADVYFSTDLRSVPAEEMTKARQYIVQTCVSVNDFIARATRASQIISQASPVAPRSGGNRFNMTQNGKKMTADDFDAWMRANGIRVAGGKANEQQAEVVCTPTKEAPCPK